MKRKIFALVLVVALVASVAVGLAACNNNDENVVVVGYTLYEPMNYMQDFGGQTTVIQSGLKNRQTGVGMARESEK